MSSLDFHNRVAIVTGAGTGLGRSHALELARRGARIVVNDLGGAVDGVGQSLSAAEAVVEEIQKNGGEAIANGANVTATDDVVDMVSQTLSRWGQVDILINNAGILRDKSFSKMTIDDFRTVLDVHLTGSFVCTKAVWDPMRERQYGRVVMTSSSSGLYGNFGQSNYGAAKAGLVGLMNVLAIEGASKNIHVNTIAPVAFTRMTENLLPEEAGRLLTPESVTPAVMVLAHESAPTRTILCAGAGTYASTKIIETEGVFLPEDLRSAEDIMAALVEIENIDGATVLENGPSQTVRFVTRAMEEAGKSGS